MHGFVCRDAACTRSQRCTAVEHERAQATSAAPRIASSRSSPVPRPPYQHAHAVAATDVWYRASAPRAKRRSTPSEGRTVHRRGNAGEERLGDGRYGSRRETSATRSRSSRPPRRRLGRLAVGKPLGHNGGIEAQTSLRSVAKAVDLQLALMRIHPMALQAVLGRHLGGRHESGVVRRRAFVEQLQHSPGDQLDQVYVPSVADQPSQSASRGKRDLGPCEFAPGAGLAQGGASALSVGAGGPGVIDEQAWRAQSA